MKEQDRDEIEYRLHVEARREHARRHMENIHRQIDSGSGRRINPEILDPKKGKNAG